MLSARRTTFRTTAGTITRLCLERIKLRASEMITPQLGVGAWVPAPRKLRLASTMMALDSTTEATTSIAPSTFGRRCRKSVRVSRLANSSAERRVGKECVSRCRYRWDRDENNKKNRTERQNIAINTSKSKKKAG